MPGIEMIKRVADEDYGVAVEMYYNNAYADKPITVRLRDTDAEETVECVICPNRAIADRHFAEMVGPAQ